VNDDLEFRPVGRWTDLRLHFPISENYPLCKEYLWPAVCELAAPERPA
jgi:hypothetical protein